MEPIFFTPEQYVLYNLLRYPALFSGSTYDDVKMRVYDQLFNVIGNGIRDDEELISELTYSEFPEEEAKKFITSEPIYWAYAEYDEREVTPDLTIKIGKGKSIVYTESEREHHPEIQVWTQSSRYPFDPYPNFQRKYSVVFRTHFLTLCGDEWKAEAKWFYEQCKKFFEHTEESKGYVHAFPHKKQHETNNKLYDMTQRLKNYFSYEEVEKAYGIPFDGDVEKFCIERWNKEKAKILRFINRTIQLCSK